tara:strand:+ start:1215 stop:2393 length:1179 start_codon:yes stop_codon:yes gene_type:complete
LKIAIVGSDLLYPTNSGGRLESRGMIEALMAAGHTVETTLFQREDVRAEDLELNARIGEETFIVRRPSFLITTLASPLLPYQLASRIGTAADRQRDAARWRGFDIVIALQEWALPYARSVAKCIDAPLVLRSQNDEVHYLASQARSASTGIKKAYLTLERLRAGRSFTAGFYRGVALVLPISPRDANYYHELAVPTEYLPPTMHVDSAGIPLTERGGGIVFAGSLDLPQTAAGIEWFVRDVWPLVLAAIPTAKLSIAGRRAPARLRDFLSTQRSVAFLGEVATTEPLLRTADVFINPIFGGSGVNMKIGAPARAGIPLVSTTTGLRGLQEISEAVRPTDAPEAFAERCVELLQSEKEWTAASTKVRRAIDTYSGESTSRRLIQILRERCLVP